MSKYLLRNTFIAALLLTVILLSAGCKKKSTVTAPTVPVLTTTNVIINLTATTAQSGGSITSIGDATITANGICYSTTDKTPTTSDSKTSDTVNLSTLIFKTNLAGLSPSTTYYMRAYAINSAGTGYGAVVTFTTTSTSSIFTATATTIAGNGTAGYTDGSATTAQFNSPQGIVADAQGNFYISDTYNNVIRKISAGGVVSTFAGSGAIGNANGTGTGAQFYGPQGLAIDASGNVYVADAGNDAIRKITPAGVVSTFAGYAIAGTPISGFEDGQGSIARFNSPHGLTFDGQGNLLVADRGNNNIRRITPGGLVTTLSGTIKAGYVNATAGIAASYNNPTAVAVDAAGDIYVADQGNSAIRKITNAGIVTTVAGGPTQSSDVGYPAGMVIDANGTLFISDESGRVMELTSAGALYSLAGNINTAGFANGTGAVVQFNSPQSITMDTQGNFYVADSNNNIVRKLVLGTAMLNAN